MKDKEIKLLDLQIVLTVIYIVSLVLSIFLTYNDRIKLSDNKNIFSKKQSKNYSIFNRVLVLVLTLSFLFINYENYKITKQKGEKLDNASLQILASEISTVATIIVLYVVLKSAGEDYTIISGIENPSL